MKSRCRHFLAIVVLLALPNVYANGCATSGDSALLYTSPYRLSQTADSLLTGWAKGKWVLKVHDLEQVFTSAMTFSEYDRLQAIAADSLSKLPIDTSALDTNAFDTSSIVYDTSKFFVLYEAHNDTVRKVEADYSLAGTTDAFVQLRNQLTADFGKPTKSSSTGYMYCEHLLWGDPGRGVRLTECAGGNTYVTYDFTGR